MLGKSIAVWGGLGPGLKREGPRYRPRKAKGKGKRKERGATCLYKEGAPLLLKGAGGKGATRPPFDTS